MFASLGDMFNVDKLLGGIGRKLEKQDWAFGSGWLQDILLKVFDPKKGLAGGGTFSKGQSILVGEMGPELILPSGGGRVLSNQRLESTRKNIRELENRRGAGNNVTAVDNKQITDARKTTNVTHVQTSLINTSSAAAAAAAR